MEVEGIENNYRLQYGASPTPEQLAALIDRYIQEEVYYREALRLKLGDNDEIVRRRLVQKYEFLEQDLGTPPPPSDAELRAYYETYRERYAIPERLTFSQVFFSIDRAGEADAKARAARALTTLNDRRLSRAPGLGDSFPGEADYAEVTPMQVRRAFGASSLSELWTFWPSRIIPKTSASSTASMIRTAIFRVARLERSSRRIPRKRSSMRSRW
jgi:hypothetical protein